MTKVVIEVRGGVVQDVFTDTEEVEYCIFDFDSVEYCIIDFDSIESGEEQRQGFETMAMDNKRMQAIEDGKYPESADHPDYVAGKFVCRVCGGNLRATQDVWKYLTVDPNTGSTCIMGQLDSDAGDGYRWYCDNGHNGEETGWKAKELFDEPCVDKRLVKL